MTQLQPITVQHQQPPTKKEIDFLLQDNLKSLTSEEKFKFYMDLCKHCELDPITKPFGLYDFKGKEVLYIKSEAYDQLCARNRVTRKILPQDVIVGDKVIKQDFVTMGSTNDDLCYLVKVEASRMIEGERVSVDDVAVVLQFDESYGKYKRNMNALMKAITKAYRRAAKKLVSIGNVMLEDELDEGGESREITATGSVGGKKAEMLDYQLPQKYNGYTNLKELMLKEGDDALIKLDEKLGKQPDLSEQWKAVRVVINKYMDVQVANESRN